MKRKLPWYRTIIFRLMLIVIVTLIPILLIFGGLYRVSQRNMIENLKENTFIRDEQIFENFYSKINEAESYVRALYQTGKVSYLSDMWEYYDVKQRAEKIAEIQEKIQWYRFMEGFITDITIYLPQRGVCIQLNSWREMNEEDNKAVEIYMKNPETLIIEQGNVQLYMGDLNYGGKTDQIRTICRMSLSSYRFQKMLTQLCEDKVTEAVILIDDKVFMENIQDENVLSRVLDEYQKKKDEGSGSFQIANGNKYFCTFTGGPVYRINIICCRLYEKVFARTKESSFFIVAMIIVNCMVVLFIFLYVKKYIKRPITILYHAFNHINDGNEGVLIEEQSGDEFEELYMGFNEMSRRLAVNVRDNYLTKISLQREQLKQLQAQINPHFLYNTLLFIKIRIKKGDLEGAEKMTGLLSDYFRFINRNKRDVISLEEELECICTYMQIQTERFSNRFHFIAESCPEDMKMVPVPRLLLQPLVENAVKYGMERIEENGWVKVSFRKAETKICVIVEESGMEIGQEEIDELNDRIQDPGNQEEITSTININQRIKLYYGDEYGLRYEKTKDGTFCAIAELDGGKIDEKMEGNSSR